MQQTTENRIGKYLPILMAFIVLVIFGKVANYDFLNYDDDIHVYENPRILYFSLENLLYFFSNPHEGLYIPLTYSLWGMQSKLAQYTTGFSPHIFHLSNLICHILSMLLVFGLLKKIINNVGGACIGALFFALHPAQVESLAWVSGFRDLLGGFFALAAIYIYFYKENLKFRLCASFAFILAILSKPNMVVTPVIAGVLSWWWFHKRSFKDYHWLFLWSILTLPIIIITKSVQPNISIIFVPSAFERFLIAMDSLSFYFFKIIWPLNNIPDYGRSPKWLLQHNWVYLSGFVTLLIIFTPLFFKKVANWWRCAIVIWLIALAPVLGIIPFGFQDFSTVADRYLYLAMFGPALLIARTFAYFQNEFVELLLAIIVVFYALVSVYQIEHWKNSQTLFQYTLRVNPASSLAQSNIGMALHKEQKISKAIYHYKEALRLNPNLAETYNNLGLALQQQRKIAKAFFCYKKAQKLAPNDSRVYNNLGNIWQIQGRLDMAILCYKKALQLNPYSAKLHNNLGIALHKLGELNEAIFHYRQALKINPHLQTSKYLQKALWEKKILENPK